VRKLLVIAVAVGLAGCESSPNLRVVLGVDRSLRSGSTSSIQVNQALLEEAAGRLRARYGWRVEVTAAGDWESTSDPAHLHSGLRPRELADRSKADVLAVFFAGREAESRQLPWDNQLAVAVVPGGPHEANVAAITGAFERLAGMGAPGWAGEQARFLKAMDGFPYAGGLAEWTGAKYEKLKQAWTEGGGDPQRLHPLLADLFATRGDHVRAAFYREIAQKESPAPAIQLSLAADYYRSKQLPRAIEVLERLVAANPAFPGAQRDLGIYQAMNGNKQAAENALAKAVGDDPADATARLNLGSLIAEQVGRRHEAMAHFAVILEQQPGHNAARKNLEVAQAEEKRYGALAQAMEAQLKGRPSATGFVQLGSAYARMGDLAKAFAALSTAVKMAPASVTAHQNLATIALLRNDRSRAEAEVEVLNKLGAPPAPAFVAAVASAGTAGH
jgi:tetratricopeptide (TPR) repeat protein